MISIFSIFLFIMIAVFPIGLMFGNSVIIDGSLSLKHYFSVFSDNRAMSLFIKSLTLASVTTGLSIFTGVPFALFLAKSNFPGKKICKWLYLIPLFIPPHIHAVAWIHILGENGYLYGTIASCVILSLSYFPFVVLLTLSGLYAMDQRFEEAASLTSKPLAVLNKITLPLIRPYILSGAVFVFIFSLFNYGVPALFRVHVYPVEIFASFSAFYDEGAATAQSLPIVLVALALLLGQRYFMKKRSYVTIDSGTKRNESLLLYKYRKSAFFFAWSILLFSVILPVSVLLMRANRQSYGAALQTSHKAIITTVVISTYQRYSCYYSGLLYLGSHGNQKQMERYY